MDCFSRSTVRRAAPDLDKSVRQSDNMNISSQDPSQEVAHVNNGDSGADTNPALFEHVEQPVDYNALIETALNVEFGTEPDGANFTVNLRQIKLTPEQRGAIKND